MRSDVPIFGPEGRGEAAGVFVEKIIDAVAWKMGKS